MKLPLPLKLAVGVNLSPALPWAKVMKLPLVIGVVPSFWYSAAVGDPGDLEVGHFGTIRNAVRDHQPAGLSACPRRSWRWSPTACRLLG